MTLLQYIFVKLGEAIFGDPDKDTWTGIGTILTLSAIILGINIYFHFQPFYQHTKQPQKTCYMDTFNGITEEITYLCE